MRELTDGVWQLAGLVPHVVNTYLISIPEGDVLIDAGTRWAARRILRELRGRKMVLVALTHVHPDHQGAAAAVCRRHGRGAADGPGHVSDPHGTSAPVRPAGPGSGALAGRRDAGRMARDPRA